MKLRNDFDENAKYIEKGIGLPMSYDVGCRKVRIFPKRINIYFLTGMVEGLEMIKVVASILAIPREKEYSFSLIHENLAHHNLSLLTDLDEMIVNILNGMAVILLEDSTEAISLDVRSYPNRSITEPEME
ncbi:MAG: spore germination protein, partial [Bacilli bacterium]|nr:spore germination protein [Bacilli bacterium]